MCGGHLERSCDSIVSNSGTKLSARRAKAISRTHRADAGHYCDVCKYVYHLCCCVARTQTPQPTPVPLPPFYREAIFTGDFLDMSPINLPVGAALPHQQTVVLSVPLVEQLILCYCPGATGLGCALRPPLCPLGSTCAARPDP